MEKTSQELAVRLKRTAYFFCRKRTDRILMLGRMCLVIVVVLAVMSCSSMNIRYDYDREADFSGYKSYDWTPGPQRTTGDPYIDNPLLDARIRTAVEKQLAEQGFVKAESGQPNFHIAYHAALRKRLDFTMVNQYYGYPYYRGYPAPATWGTADVREYTEGTLLLDILDANTKQLVWRGYAQAEISLDVDPEEKDKRVKEAVQKILTNFPPK